MKVSTLLYERELELEDKEKAKLEYYLTEEKGIEGKCPAFGIVLVKKTGNMIEFESTDQITENKNLVCEMIRKLADNTVTPMCLCEVVDDILHMEEKRLEEDFFNREGICQVQ